MKSWSVNNMGEKLSLLFVQKKKKPSELAKYLGISRAMITKWKNGTMPVAKKWVPSIAEFFGVPVEELTSNGKQLSDLFPKIEVNPAECNREVRTYGDVIRHMDDDELALFLREMHANIELGLLAIMRAKSYPHRRGGDKHVETRKFDSIYSFMKTSIHEVAPDEYDVFGVDNWQDMCQWQFGFNTKDIWGEF